LGLGNRRGALLKIGKGMGITTSIGAQIDVVENTTMSVSAHNRHDAPSILKFQMHHHVGFDHN